MRRAQVSVYIRGRSIEDRIPGHPQRSCSLILARSILGVVHDGGVVPPPTRRHRRRCRRRHRRRMSSLCINVVDQKESKVERKPKSREWGGGGWRRKEIMGLKKMHVRAATYSTSLTFPLPFYMSHALPPFELYDASRFATLLNHAREIARYVYNSASPITAYHAHETSSAKRIDITLNTR